MKKILAVVLCIILTFLFVACKESEGGNASQQGESMYSGVVEKDSKMMEIIGSTLNDVKNPYTLIYKINVDGTELRITQAVKDGMVYMEFDYQNSTIKNLYDAVTGYNYAIYDSEKLVFKSTQPQTKIEPFDNPFNELNKTFTRGEEEVNGTVYNYEKATGDNVYLTLYFDANGKLCYMDSNGTLMEIVAYDATIDNAYFDIPDDYMMMEM